MTSEQGLVVRQRKRRANSDKHLIYTARLGVDVTPALRARIKVSAFKRGMTLAEMLRELLERQFPVDGPEDAA